MSDEPTKKRILLVDDHALVRSGMVELISARADLEKQEYWLRTRLPAIKKKPPHAGG